MNKPANDRCYCFLPNLITSFNLVAGSIAVYFAFSNQLKTAVVLMFAAAIFDFFDGLIARMLSVSGDLGKELDSLADVVSFGLLPGAIAFSILHSVLLTQTGYDQFSFVHWALLFLPVLIPVMSALRLAKFNLDTRQTKDFIGVPTPANALFWAGMGWYFTNYPLHLTNFNASPFLLAFFVIFMSAMLVVEVKMFSLKFSSLTWRDNWMRFLLLIVAAFFLIGAGIPGLSPTILFYILMGFAIHFFSKKANR